MVASPVAWASDGTEAFEAKVLELINAQRMLAGLQALWQDTSLQAAADAHSLDMAANNCFSHDSCNGTSFATRVRGYYSANTSLGEIIAAGYATPEAVVAGWMNSPGHRANILGDAYKVAGVGLVNGTANSSYRTYWTVDFGGATTSTSVQPVLVPEASSWVMMAMGLVGIAAVRRARSA
ncbi:CAP domain-containing protein [Aquabacterium lacunae]|uniref:CAP domain-containing protein n=1 Tax=Aquabacterium lacunae TaxID=2528630 RepID=A0A4Q9H5S8_9BURK|nr:CAP domain-containing protein [Aquabacterium lacunae]